VENLMRTPTKERPFKAALRRAVADAGDDPVRLRAIADALVREAESGSVVAIKEVADRLDGRVAQRLAGDADEDPIEVQHVDLDLSKLDEDELRALEGIFERLAAGSLTPTSAIPGTRLN
jgi:hypothetical protein